MSTSPETRQRQGRIIAHVDMDAFFVEAELLLQPQLRGEKLIVAREGDRSVVLSASYQARKDGVGSAMPLSQARRLSPQAKVLEPHMDLYRELSASIMTFLDTITDRKEQLSIDEAFLDLTGARRRLGEPHHMGQLIRRGIKEQLGLPATVGIADRKYLAKIASTRAKPDGLLVIPPAQRLAFLHSLPVSALWGVGKKTQEQLQSIGITEVAQVAQTPPESLRHRFGAAGEQLWRLASGEDPREVEPVREEKSIGAEHTLGVDLSAFDDLSTELLRLSHRVASRLRSAEKTSAHLSLKIRFRDFTTFSRAITLPHPTQSAQVIHRAVADLLLRQGALPQPVRLVGVRAEQVASETSGLQLSFDVDQDAWSKAERTLDGVSQRFPEAPLQPARFLRGTRKLDGTGEKPE